MRKQTENPIDKFRFFTLIELLVVIAIIAITTSNSMSVKHVFFIIHISFSVYWRFMITCCVVFVAASVTVIS